MTPVHVSFILKVFVYTVLSFYLFVLNLHSINNPFGYLIIIVLCVVVGLLNSIVFGALFFRDPLQNWLQKNAFTVVVIECFCLSFCGGVHDICAKVICLMALLLISRISDMRFKMQSRIISVSDLNLKVAVAFSLFYVAGFFAYFRSPEDLGNGYKYYPNHGELEIKLPQSITDAAYNERYIILEEWPKTESNRNDSHKYPLGPGHFYYYIIDKDKNAVTGPMTEAQFRDSCQEKDIRLRFPPRDRGGNIWGRDVW